MFDGINQWSHLGLEISLWVLIISSAYLIDRELFRIFFFNFSFVCFGKLCFWRNVSIFGRGENLSILSKFFIILNEVIHNILRVFVCIHRIYCEWKEHSYIEWELAENLEESFQWEIPGLTNCPGKRDRMSLLCGPLDSWLFSCRWETGILFPPTVTSFPLHFLSCSRF